MTTEEFHSTLLTAGTPEPLARLLSDTDPGIAKGALFDDGHVLSRLIGRPTTPYEVTITDCLRQHRSANHGMT